MYYKRVEEDPLIGHRFGKSGQVEVIGWAGKSLKSIRKYLVKCHICASDPELYRDATYKIARNEVMEGCLPCGCSLNPRWKDWQYKVKVERSAKERGYTFNKFIGHPVCAKTKIELTCNTCNSTWNTCTVSRFLIGNGCITCGRKAISLARTKSDEDMSAGFMATGNFHLGTKFSRSERLSVSGYSPYWFYTCPICSFDEYVKEGLCSGSFEAHGSHLKQGKLSCRCSTNFAWTKPQREYQIKRKLLVSPKYSFAGWSEEYRKNTSKFNVLCSEHGVWETSVANLISGNHLCPSCAGPGFDLTKPSNLYVLSVTGAVCDFTGFGLSSNVVPRLKKHKSNLSSYGFKIDSSTVITIPTRARAFEIERSLKREFPAFPQEVEGFKTEATHAHLYQDVVDFVQEALKQ